MRNKILKGIGIFILVVIMVVIATVATNKNVPPPQLVTNFVDVNQITKVSKFRSCAGHVTVPQDVREEKRSMKHYFWVKPELVGTDSVKIFAPYDGYVSDIRTDQKENLEGEIWIIPKRTLAILPPIGVWQFSVQHIVVRKDLKRGSEVKAGEVIGHAAIPTQERASFDIVYAKQALAPKMIDNWNSPFSDLDSVFNHMTDAVLAEYQDKGVVKDNFFISKEYRDNNLCQYQGAGPYFENQEDQNNWVIFK